MKTTPFAPNKDQLLLAEISAAFNHKKYPDVIQLATRFLKKHPNHAQVLHQYAISLAYTQRLKEAKPIFQRVIALVPNEVLPQLHLARVHQDLKELFDAKILFLQIIKRWPNNLDAHASYGAILQSANKIKDAERIYRRALEIAPNSILNGRNLAGLLLAQGNTSEASSIYQTFWEETKSPIIGMEFADLLVKNDAIPEAMTIYNEILDSKINQAPALLGLANANQKNGDNSQAITLYEQVLKLNPTNPHTLFNLATTLLSTKKIDLAIHHLEKGRSLYKDNPMFSIGLAKAYHKQGKLHDAKEILNELHKQFPHSAEYLGSLGNTFFAANHFYEAEKTYRTSLVREPNSLVARSNLYYLLDVNIAVTSNTRQREKILFGARQSRTPHNYFEHKTKKNDFLNIGLISSDLRNHPVGHFLDAVIAAVKKLHGGKINFFIYSNSTTIDDLSRRIKNHSTAWRLIPHLSDQAAADAIHQENTHILIDLSGHTSGNRLGIFARRPAPVQVSWLGYFATTGLNEIDYLITDTWSQPEYSEEFFSETLWPLPKTRLCFTPPDLNLEVSHPPYTEHGHITFGSFNQYRKLNEEVISTWAKVLLRVPDSRLFLKTRALADPQEQQTLAKKFENLGIAANRLIMEGESSREDYLACFSRVDISLDPFPYTGGTTTVESLWMGVPVLTLAGKTLIGRQGLGLLMNAGLEDWVAYSQEEYIEKAVQWAQRPEDLAALRAKLRQQVLASPLFDADAFAQHFVDAMEQMWAKYLENPTPRPIRWPEYPIDPAYQGTVRIVSATMKSEADFWAEAALGRSLPYHLERDPRIKALVAFDNRRGLSEIFNEAIEAADDDDILVFMHDDVWLDELGGLTQILCEGLENFDVWGVAGNKRRLPGQTGWGHLDDNLTPDMRMDFSGRIAHGDGPYGVTSYFGDMPAACELLDGVFLVTQKQRLQPKKVRFDPRFDFHLYDIDFCRTARKAGLKLGTWPIELTHQSSGNFFSEHWRKKARMYLKKWGS